MSGIPLLFIYFRLVFAHRGGEADRRGIVRLATGIRAGKDCQNRLITALVRV